MQAFTHLHVSLLLSVAFINMMQDCSSEQLHFSYIVLWMTSVKRGAEKNDQSEDKGICSEQNTFLKRRGKQC